MDDDLDLFNDDFEDDFGEAMDADFTLPERSMGQIVNNGRAHSVRHSNPLMNHRPQQPPRSKPNPLKTELTETLADEFDDDMDFLDDEPMDEVSPIDRTKSARVCMVAANNNESRSDSVVSNRNVVHNKTPPSASSNRQNSRNKTNTEVLLTDPCHMSQQSQRCSRDSHEQTNINTDDTSSREINESSRTAACDVNNFTNVKTENNKSASLPGASTSSSGIKTSSSLDSRESRSPDVSVLNLKKKQLGLVRSSPGPGVYHAVLFILHTA